MVLSESPVNDTCGQTLRSISETEVKMIDFNVDPTRPGLRNFNEFFKDNLTTHTLMEIFNSEEIAACQQNDLRQDLLSASLPNYLPIPLTPHTIIRPDFDFLTKIELGPLSTGEILEPTKFFPQPAVGILIEIDGFEYEKKPLSFNEAEEIFRFLYPELEIIPNENLQPIQDEIPAASVGEIERKKKKKRQRKRKSTDDIVEPIVETSPEKPKRLQTTMMPKRKDLSKAGQLGTKTQIFVNMLAIEFGDNLPSQIEQYCVSCEPSKSKSLTYKAYLAAKSQLFPEINPAYSDGVIFSANCLPIESPFQLTVKVKEHDNSEEIQVKLKISKVIRKDGKSLNLRLLKNIQDGLPKDKKNIAAVSALQLIMNSVARNQKIRANGSYFIPPEDGPRYLGGGLEMCYGLFQSVTVGWRPFLKVDVMHKGFAWDINVIDYVKSIVNSKFNDLIFDDFESKWDLINEKLCHLQVAISCNNEKRFQQSLIVSLVNKRPYEIACKNDNGETTNVHDYFLKENNYEIRYPNLPCLLIVNRENHSYVPMELCTIECEKSFKWSKLSKNQQENLRKASITDANKRRLKILHVFNTVNQQDDVCLKSFDVSVSREFEKVDARILEPPTLFFYQNKEVKPESGIWNTERFLISSHRLVMNNSWTILNLSNIRLETLYSFSTTFIQEATKLGLPVGAPRLPFIDLIANSDMKYMATCLQSLKQLNVQLVIVVIPEGFKQLYCAVKQLAEVNVGILTQCVNNTSTKYNTDEETVRNIVMKVNAKLQGINYSFVRGFNRPRCLWEPCIILGADVTHPKSKNEPSIAAVVASFDPNTYFQYNVELRFQPPGVELMDDLEEIMKKQLLNYYRRSGCKPMKIIFYRDGVGEGDFVHVMNKELLAIRRACISLEEVYQPPITFMIVQKRIHTKFFPVSNKDIGDWNYNVKVGTVVDTVVTHPTDIEFILVSHPSDKGTANPTKYRCLWDDSNHSEDELEQLTYNLCHMSARSSKSIKYPAPTYYAHLAAARARALSSGMNIDLNDLSNEQVKLKVHRDLLIHSPMYFL